ncbi:nuclear transport factor 2 family protein [Pseudomonas putida]|nr:nuclear transport factor 2 family protein [Pseudomonas putida]
MCSAAELLHHHFEMFVDDHEKWKSLLAPDIVWELPFAPSLGHPEKLVGREQVLNHVGWFVGAVESFQFHNLRIQQFTDPLTAVAHVKAQGIITETGKPYSREYVVFVSVREGKLTHIREYFDPVQAAYALDSPVVMPG